MPRSAEEKGGKPHWTLVDRFDVPEYQCGMKAGDVLRLRKTLRITSHKGIPTGKRYHSGGIWRVLAGSTHDPGVVFLRQPDGQIHVWDNSPEIFDWFELI